MTSCLMSALSFHGKSCAVGFTPVTLRDPCGPGQSADPSLGFSCFLRNASIHRSSQPHLLLGCGKCDVTLKASAAKSTQCKWCCNLIKLTCFHCKQEVAASLKKHIVANSTWDGKHREKHPPSWYVSTKGGTRIWQNLGNNLQSMGTEQV